MEMDSNILVINPGSTSKKFGFYSQGKIIAEAYFESTKEGHLVTWDFIESEESETIDQMGFENARNLFVSKLTEKGLIATIDDLTAVGVRIVSPGTFFLKHHLITTDVLEKIEAGLDLAPLHLTPALAEIRSLMLDHPNLKVVAVSDSQFHHTVPEHAYLYGIDYKDYQNYDIRSFGYHGISVSSVIRKLKNLVSPFPEKVIVCHLGGGCSITAVKNGKSVDTSMGYTPLEGLVMSTRPGDLDVGALLQLIRNNEFDYDQIENYLNKKSGLLGVSQKTGDMKTLIEGYKANDKDSIRAINLFVYRLKKYIGAYASAMGGVDYLVFTATIGERASFIRQLVCQDLAYLGFDVDDNKNMDPKAHQGYITQFESQKHIVVIPTNELNEMCLMTQEVIESTSHPQN